MPGKRSFARERARHAVNAPHQQAALYAMLTAQLPARELALVGYPAIIDHLHRLGIRRLNGGRLTARIVRQWRRHGLVIVNGRWHPRGKSLALTTSHALTAWLLTAPFDTVHLFKVASTQTFPSLGSFDGRQERSRHWQHNVAGSAA